MDAWSKAVTRLVSNFNYNSYYDHAFEFVLRAERQDERDKWVSCLMSEVPKGPKGSSSSDNRKSRRRTSFESQLLAADWHVELQQRAVKSVTRRMH
eukprot:20639-Heterococcus_DN1.PRE.2